MSKKLEVKKPEAKKAEVKKTKKKNDVTVTEEKTAAAEKPIAEKESIPALLNIPEKKKKIEDSHSVLDHIHSTEVTKPKINKIASTNNVAEADANLPIQQIKFFIDNVAKSVIAIQERKPPLPIYVRDKMHAAQLHNIQVNGTRFRLPS